MSDRRAADREQIATFVDALFRYADREGWVSLRSFFHDDRRPPARIRGVALASGLDALIRQAVKQATEAANLGEPAVFSPPIATFKTAKPAKPAKPASEANLHRSLASQEKFPARSQQIPCSSA